VPLSLEALSITRQFLLEHRNHHDRTHGRHHRRSSGGNDPRDHADEQPDLHRALADGLRAGRAGRAPHFSRPNARSGAFTFGALRLQDQARETPERQPIIFNKGRRDRDSEAVAGDAMDATDPMAHCLKLPDVDTLCASSGLKQSTNGAQHLPGSAGCRARSLADRFGDLAYYFTTNSLL